MPTERKQSRANPFRLLQRLLGSRKEDSKQPALFTDTASHMRESWEAYAAKNPMFFIHSKGQQEEFEWNEEEFFASGRNVLDVVRTYFPDRDYSDCCLLELGCGLGRESAFLTEVFGKVVALDISEGMIARARELHVDNPKLSFVVGNGYNLEGMADASFDAVYSFIMLQHITDTEIVLSYIREAARVLKPNGTFVFQLFDRPDGQSTSDDVWRCTRVGLERVKQTLDSCGLELLKYVGEGTPFLMLTTTRRAAPTPEH